MITARLAGEQGRDVFAIPGRIDQASSRGCNAFIRDGVITLASCPEDVLDSLAFSKQGELPLTNCAGKAAVEAKVSAVLKSSPVNMSEEETKIFEFLKREGELYADDISSALGVSAQSCSSTLLMLEIKKAVVRLAGGRWAVR